MMSTATESITLLASGTNLATQVGSQNKLSSSMQVSFAKPFATPPVVLISQFWNGGSGQAGYVDTITSITTTGFTVVSPNEGGDYFVNYAAFGTMSS